MSADTLFQGNLGTSRNNKGSFVFIGSNFAHTSQLLTLVSMSSWIVGQYSKLQQENYC